MCTSVVVCVWTTFPCCVPVSCYSVSSKNPPRHRMNICWGLIRGSRLPFVFWYFERCQLYRLITCLRKKWIHKYNVNLVPHQPTTCAGQDLYIYTRKMILMFWRSPETDQRRFTSQARAPAIDIDFLTTDWEAGVHLSRGGNNQTFKTLANVLGPLYQPYWPRGFTRGFTGVFFCLCLCVYGY